MIRPLFRHRVLLNACAGALLKIFLACSLEAVAAGQAAPRAASVKDADDFINRAVSTADERKRRKLLDENEGLLTTGLVDSLLVRAGTIARA